MKISMLYGRFLHADGPVGGVRDTFLDKGYLLVLLKSIGGDENGSNGENRNSALGREQRHTTWKV